MRQQIAGVCLSAFALVACRAPQPATEVLVEVSSDMMVGTDLKELRLEVYSRSYQDKEPSELRTIRLEPDAGVAGGPSGAGRYGLPVRFSVYPRPGATDFRIVVGGGPENASGEWKPIVERQAITSFLKGRRTFLPIFLAQACKQVLCTEMGQRSDKTCDQGRCIDVPDVTPQDEKTFDAGPPPSPADAGNDAQLVTDSGNLPTDSGPDDAAPAPRADAAVDAGPVDAGPVDAGPVDAGPVDAGPVDAGPVDAGPVDAGPVDAGPVDPGPCGTWVVSDKDSGPPAGATPYGHEDTTVPPFSFDQYVCRARASAGAAEFLPGKGVYPFGCFFTQVDNMTKGNADDGFEILTGTAGCAQLVSIESYLISRPALIPTGYDGTKAYYSCVASETSVVAGKADGRPLGRYIEAPPGTHDCVYEWETTTHRQSIHGAPGTSFNVLVRR